MRKLRGDEEALWARVMATVRPLRRSGAEAPPRAPETSKTPETVGPRARPRSLPPSAPVDSRRPHHGLDSGWDRRLARGSVSPDLVVDLHGRSLAGAHALLDERLESAISAGARVLLLITGKPPQGDAKPVGRGAIRAAVGDWLAVSRHAPWIAAVRQAHPRHGGAGALYIILRRSAVSNRQNS